MGLTCDECTTAINGVSTDRCDQVNYGNQVVKLFLQKMEGEQFDGTVGNDVEVAADWATKIAAVTDDHVAIIPNITATIPEQDPTIEEGQDVPYGGIEAIESTFLLEGVIRYLNETVFTEVEKLTYCTSPFRLWFLTNTDWLFGADVQVNAALGEGFDSCSFMAKTPGIDGIGTKMKIKFSIKRVTPCMPKPVANLPFLKSIAA